jgi:hypothetical protein
LVVCELVADFVDDLPCAEEKVALEVVAIHCTMGTAGCAASDEERRRGRAEGRTYRELFMHATVADRYEVVGMVWDLWPHTKRTTGHRLRLHLIL